MISNTGSELVYSKHGLLTTIAWQIGNEVTYALEGSVFIAGALIQWLRDGLQLFEDADETQGMAESVSDSGGVFVVPAFVGLGAPHWDPYARETIVGLTRDTNRNHIVRASLPVRLGQYDYDLYHGSNLQWFPAHKDPSAGPQDRQRQELQKHHRNLKLIRPWPEFQQHPQKAAIRPGATVSKHQR